MSITTKKNLNVYFFNLLCIILRLENSVQENPVKLLDMLRCWKYQIKNSGQKNTEHLWEYTL